MKHSLQSLVLVVLTVFFASCAQDIVDVTGTISGIVKDYTTGQVIENCQVALSPTGNTVVTNAEGRYTFKSLQPGTYTLTFTKIGYKDQSTTVEVISGQMTTRDIQVEAMGAIDFSTSILDFGENNSNMSFAIKNNTASPYEINLVKSVEWLSFSQTRATIGANNQMNITAEVDRSKVGPGTYNTTVTLQYTGSTSGNVVMQVKMVKAEQTVPVVETKAAFDVTATTFKIGGVISATGGSVVTAYGHCWSTNPNPTIETAQSTNYGRTTETMSFNSSINQNLVNTVVYVRAYATNAHGTGYGNEVQVTSSSVGPDEGGEFAGGTGTAISPYQLRTPTHMQNMKNYPSAYFKMVADIDMDGINWIPFELKGSFDGDGHTLYNLKISPYVTSDYQGLFSKVSGSASVWNLTIVGVEINAPSYSYVGAIAGYSGCTIGNCHVILNQSNAITGNQRVGGIVGGAQCDIKNSSVSSSLTAPVIVGNGKVGGAVGENIYHEISKVTVNCNISCGAYNGSYTYAIVGGIAGYLGGGTGSKGSISKCTYNGEITGLVPNSVYFGGIVGELSGSDISECKTNVIITASNGAGIGGIVGNASYGNICACYSQGEVHGSVNEGRSNWYGVAGITGDGGTIQHCYTLMDLGVVHYGSTPSGSFAIKDLVNQFSSPINIAEIMRTASSQYASYWNYNRTWTWTGIVNGQSVTAICPKLAWE